MQHNIHTSLPEHEQLPVSTLGAINRPFWDIVRQLVVTEKFAWGSYSAAIYLSNNGSN